MGKFLNCYHNNYNLKKVKCYLLLFIIVNKCQKNIQLQKLF